MSNRGIQQFLILSILTSIPTDTLVLILRDLGYGTQDATALGEAYAILRDLQPKHTPFTVEDLKEAFDATNKESLVPFILRAKLAQPTLSSDMLEDILALYKTYQGKSKILLEQLLARAAWEKKQGRGDDSQTYDSLVQFIEANITTSWDTSWDMDWDTDTVAKLSQPYKLSMTSDAVKRLLASLERLQASKKEVQSKEEEKDEAEDYTEQEKQFHKQIRSQCALFDKEQVVQKLLAHVYRKIDMQRVLPLADAEEELFRRAGIQSTGA